MNLRKLTRKSVLGFGKHEFLTIQQLLDLNKKDYLRWVYYCNSHIDFFDDILEELGILEYKILKPSVNKEMHEYVIRVIEQRVFRDIKYKNNENYKKVKTHKYITFTKVTQKQYFQKANLMAKNRGK